MKRGRMPRYSGTSLAVLRPEVKTASMSLVQAGVGQRIVRRFHVQLQRRFVRQLTELVGFADADDGDAAAQMAHVDAHAPALGRNFGSVISGVRSSKTTSSGMSQRRAAGSATTPTMCDIIRGPSSSSTMPMTNGAATGKPRGGRWLTTKVWMRPRPLASTQRTRRDRQLGQSGRG